MWPVSNTIKSPTSCCYTCPKICHLMVARWQPNHLMQVNSKQGKKKKERQKIFLFMRVSFFFNLFYFERETDRQTDRQQGRGRERRKERESQAGSTLSAQSPMQGSNSWTMKSWPKPKSRVGCLTNWATQAPHEQGSCVYCSPCLLISWNKINVLRYGLMSVWIEGKYWSQIWKSSLSQWYCIKIAFSYQSVIFSFCTPLYLK